jgi:Phospholipase A2-like domain
MPRFVKGAGWVTDALAKIPTELHIPGYQFCGPNTKLKERLAAGNKGINPLDAACKQHDIFYSKEKDNIKRHQADQILAEKAWKRVKSSDASAGEKLAAMLVTGAMKAKVKVGGKLKVKVAGKKKKGFNDKLRCVKKAVKLSGAKDMKSAAKVAYTAAKKVMKGIKVASKTPRIIPIPKTGGILPFLIPLFAGLSATGALASGATAIVRAVNQAAEARRALNEMKRHNETMESIALGGKKSGSGFYLKPYKSGYGLVIKPKN